MRNFEYGMLVKYKGDVYVVWDSTKDDKGILGLRNEKTNKITRASTKDVRLIKPVIVDKETLRQFFRLDKNMWELARESKFPFSVEQKSFEFTEDDLKTFCENIIDYEGFTMDAWTEYFIGNDLAYTNSKSPDNFSLKMLWDIFYEDFGWFDVEEDELDSFLKWYKVYLKNKGKLLSECKFDKYQKTVIVGAIYREYMNNKKKISNEKKKAYIKFLDESVKAGVWWAQDHKAYACYGGNGLIDCDWKESERLMLLLMKKQFNESEYANSLGYIYYSNRLGKPNYKKAFKYFSIAAKDGFVEAQYKLVDMYRKGHGVKKDVDKAYAVYEELYNRFLPAFEEKDMYGGDLADIALRMGYCYEYGKEFLKILRRQESTIDKPKHL